jgi:hypothetical protein
LFVLLDARRTTHFFDVRHGRRLTRRLLELTHPQRALRIIARWKPRRA